MKIVKAIGIIVVLLAAILVVLVIIAPKSFEVHRSVTINAAENVVWKDISTFEAFDKWNPWSKMDTTQVVKDEGQDGTIGAVHSWNGKKAGEGAMTVTKLEPNKSMEYDLHFIKPWEAHNTVDMQMKKADAGNKVTWSMKGPLSFPMNVFSLFMSMDKMIGKDFEQGLADLKKLCESAPVYKVSETDWTEKNCLSTRKTIGFKDMQGFFMDNYPKMFQTISKAGATPGIPLAVYYMYDAKTMTTDVAAAVPFDAKKNFGKEFTALNLPAAKAYSIDYYGAYEKIKPAYDAMGAKLKELGKEKPEMVIEEYITDPSTEKDTSKWFTKIYFFVNGKAVQN